MPTTEPLEELPHTQAQAESQLIRLAEKDLGMLKDKLDMSWQCALVSVKTNSILVCIRQSIASRLKDMILPLYSAVMKHI